MFPTPERVSAPGLSAPDTKLKETQNHLVQKLQAGEDDAEGVMGYLVSGGPPTAALLFASLGNRLAGTKGCPMSLTTLLAMKADPNVSHPQIGPALCWAARNGDAEIVEKLLNADADKEALDPDGGPPLKCAILAGAPKVALELIDKGANVHWTHHDGATLLHIVISWLCDGDAAGMNRRMAPVGDQPLKLVKKLIYHGVDPTAKQKWEGRGLSAVDTWRARKDESPWLADDGDRRFQDFRDSAVKIHTLFTKTADALERKASANAALKRKEFDSACEGYAAARSILGQAMEGGMKGHHLASLWSNEAICRLQLKDTDKARDACKEGLKLHCSDELRKKLQFNLEKCDALVGEEGKAASGYSEKATAHVAKVEAKKAARSNLEKGFFGKASESLYGPEGSKQGQMPQYYQQPINGGEAVINVPINQPNCAQMNLIHLPDDPNPRDDVDDSGCIAKDC